jgi:formylglycine-generating enzyme required for sulfatase activity
MKLLWCFALLLALGGNVVAQPQVGLAFLRADLPDGTTWTLGNGGIGRPFKARLLLVNQGKEPVTIWDYQNSEGAQCPGVILTDEKGKETILRPAPIERITGVPSAITIPPTQTIAIELELLRLIGERGLPPGKYRLKGFYENKLKNDKSFIKSEVWLGRIESDPVEITIVAPKIGGQAAPRQESVEAQPRKAPPKHFTNSIGMKFVWIPPGTFMMGSPENEERRDSEDETQHKVTLTKGFYMGVYTVTQEEWQAVMGTNPSHFKGEKNLPVDSVSFFDCQEFIKILRKKDKNPYRLPTEAEWEHACRAGTTTAFHFGDTISTDQANYNGYNIYGNGKKGVTREKTTPVGSFPPNGFGLYDMHGNVFQWCQDKYGVYPQNEEADPQGPNKGNSRVMRGGSWGRHPAFCRSAYRFRNSDGYKQRHNGCRVCFNLE